MLDKFDEILEKSSLKFFQSNQPTLTEICHRIETRRIVHFVRPSFLRNPSLQDAKANRLPMNRILEIRRIMRKGPGLHLDVVMGGQGLDGHWAECTAAGSPRDCSMEEEQ